MAKLSPIALCNCLLKSYFQDIFIHLSRLDHDKYFMCNMEDFKYLANIIEHIPLALRVRYTLCSAPISSQDTFTCNMFIKVRYTMYSAPFCPRWLCYSWAFSSCINICCVEIVKDKMSLLRKQAFCICENKDADQLRGNREADQRLCFRYTDSTIPLLPIYKTSSL